MDGLVGAQLHQQQRDQQVEHQPNHPPGMAVRQAGEEVGPGDRPGIGVGDVDLELGQHDEQAGDQQRRPGCVHHLAERHQVHLRRPHRRRRGQAGAAGGISQERPGEQLHNVEPDPARPGQDQRRPPGLPAAHRARRQEAQVVHLLGGLRNQRQQDGGANAELQQVEPGGGARPGAAVGGPVRQPVRMRGQHRAERQQVQRQPHRLGQQLEAADEGDAMRDQRQHCGGTQDVAQPERHAEEGLQHGGHDHRLDAEEDEGEAGIDQRGDGGADVAEPGAAGEQVHVYAGAGGAAADRQADDEDQHAHEQDGGDAVGEPVGHGDGAADGLQRQERHRAQRSLRHPRRRPAPRPLGGEAQRVVLQGLVGDPAVIVAAFGNDALAAYHCCSRPSLARH